MADSGNTDPKQLLEASEETSDIEEGQVKSKDFFWDSIVLYLVSVILALAAVDALIEFIRGSEVSCITPDGQPTTDFITNYCSSSLPISQYVPGFIFIHGLAISIPHYLWAANTNGQFQSFAAVVTSLDRFREEESGKYSKKNFNLVYQLEQTFTAYGRNSIFYLYVGKSILQLVIAVASLVISIVFFTDFDAVFYCPKDNNTSDVFWPLSTQVTCVFQSLRLLYWIRLLDMIIIVFIVLSVLLALWFCISGHPNELGASQVARFSFESGMKPLYYVPSWRVSPRCFAVITKYFSSPFVSPKITTDLDFLLMKLFSCNSSLAQVFKDVQIDRTTNSLLDDDYLLTRKHKTKWFQESEKDIALPEVDVKWNFSEYPKPKHSGKEDITITVPNTVRGAVLGLCSLSLLPDKSMIRRVPFHGALVMGFSQSGLALSLARVFKRVGSILFTEFKRTISEDADLLDKLIDVEAQMTNVVDVTAPENILIAKTDLSAKVQNRLEPIWTINKRTFFKTSFIVVGPMTHRQATRISLFLNLLSTATIRDNQSKVVMSYLRDGCVLVCLRPITISGRNVREEFSGLGKPLPNFQPINIGLRVSKNLVDWPPKEVTPPTTVGLDNPLEEEHVPMTTIKGAGTTVTSSEVKSIVETLMCGDIGTRFEIDVYKYVIPKRVADDEAESMKLKEESKEKKEERPKPDEGQPLLEKTPNIEQAKKNQSNM